MDDRDDLGVAADKQWASKYILGPLHDPEPSQVFATRFKGHPPTRPTSKSLTRQRRKATPDQDDEDQRLLHRLLTQSNSVNTKALPPSPPRTRHPSVSGLGRKRSIHTATPPQTRWNQGTILSRANSVATSRPSAGAMAAVANQDHPRRRAGSLAERSPGGRPHRHLETLTQEHRARNGDDTLPRRAVSLKERYPGDMSHRPLAMLTREHRAADRAPHLRNHRRQQPSDTIDSLDLTGPVPGAYHHDGPFDATLKARNTGKKLAPIDAVRDTNLKALKATPAEYVQDSLTKHVPLQGTAVIPPGMRDMSGRTMDYEEGADLMREADAAGGPYKRWDHVRYRDDDLKGKGEPSFSADLKRREQGHRGKQKATSHGGNVYYEMQPTTAFPEVTANSKRKEGGARVRQRSVSNGDELQPSMAGSSGLQRSNTTGKGFSQSLKRRFGSLRKKAAEDGGY